MNREREVDIEESLKAFTNMELYILVRELLELRRDRHRDKLEGQEDEQVRGRAKECKDLLHIFS